MADSKDAQNQLNIQQQINKVLADRAGILESQAKQITAQVQLAAELCKALDCKELEGLSDRLGEINNGLKQASENATNLADGTKEAGKAGEESAKKAGGLAGAFSKAAKEVTALDAAAAGAAAGMAKGFKGAIADLQMVGAAAMTAAGNLMNIGKSILSIPFKMFSGLVGMATAGGGGVNELKKAMEEVRGEFGDLATGEGKAVIDGFNDLRSSSGALAKTGIPLSKIYGRGKGGLAAAMKDVAELAKEAGGSFHMLSGSLMQNAGQLAMMRKGLGMTNAALIEMTRQAQNAGVDVGDMLNQTTSMAIRMGDKFGISAKTMGKNMSKLTENFAKLGKMSVKELGATAAYMAKVGIEAEDLLSVVDKFDTFESAADSASQLNQVFGLQIDAMEMMNAQNPAERIDMMRDAFHQTGKSVEDLTRQEKALMAEQMGLSVSAMENALAAENQGVSYEDMEAGAAEAEEQAMTQEEAMSKLADSIEKMVEGGGGGLKGFFDAFAKGFMKGLKQGKQFREVLKAIRKALKIVFQFGKQVGKMFEEMMGEMGVWDGIKDLFDPKDLRNLLGINEKGGLTGTGLLGIFKKFKDALSGKGTYSPQQMAEDVGKEFGKFFSLKGPAFKKLGDAFAKGIQMLGSIISGLIPWVIGKLSDLISGMADFIRNPKGLKGAATSGIGGAIIGAIMDIGKALVAAAPVLLGAILDLLSAVFEKHGGKIIAVGAAMFTFVLMKTLIFGAIAAAKAALFQVLVAKLVKTMSGGMDEAAKKSKKGSKAGKSMGKSFKDGMSGMADGLHTFISKIAAIKPGQIIKAGINMGLFALSFIPAMAAFALGLVVVAAILSLIKFGTLMKGILALALAVPTVAMMVYAAMLLQPAMIVPATIGMLAGALMLTVGGLAFAIALGIIGIAVKSVGIGTIMASIPALVAMGLGSMAMSAALVPLAVLGSLLGLVGLALVGMVAAALMLTVGGIGFIIAIGAIGEATLAVGLGKIAAALLGLTALGLAAGVVALSAYALTLGIPFFPAGVIGAILGAAFLIYGGVPFMMGVGIFSEIVKGIPMKPVVKAMLALVLLTAATVGVAYIMTAGAAIFATGIVGAAVAAGFMFVVAKLLMPAIVMAQKAGPKDPVGAALLMVKMAVLMGAAVVTAYVMAIGIAPFGVGLVSSLIASLFFKALGNYTFPALVEMQNSAAAMNMPKAILVMAGLAMLMYASTLAAMATAMGVYAYAIGAAGALTSILFFKALTVAFPHISAAINAADVGTLTKGVAVMTMMALIMIGAAVMAVAALVMIIFANPITAWVAKKGFKAAGSMFSAMVEHFGPPISKLAKMNVPDPAAIEAIVRAMAGIMTAMGDNVDIVLKLAVLQYFAGKDASILKDAESFMNSMFEGMSGLLKELRRMVSSMSVEDIKKMEAIGGVLAGIGKLIQAMMPPPALIEAMADMAGGGMFKKANPKGATDMLKQYGETMKMILNAVKKNIPPMIKQLLKIDVGDDPKMAKAKADLLGATMGGVGAIAGAIGGIAGSFMEQNQSEQAGLFRKSGPSMADTLEAMKPVFEYIMGIVKDNLKPIVTAVLEAVPEDIDPKGADSKMKIIGGAMTAVAQFAQAIGTIADLMPEAGGGFMKKGKSMSERLGEMMSIIRKVVNAVKAHIGPLVKSVTGIKIDGDPKAMLVKMEIIGKAMDAVGKFASVIEQLQGLGGGFIDLSPLIHNVVQSIINSTSGGDFTLDKLFPILAEFSGTAESIGKLDILKDTFTKLGSFAMSMGELHESGALSAGGLFGVANSPFVEGVRMLVNQTKFALEQLNSLGEMDANVALENFASAIGTGGGEFTITNEPINITINMNVTMDANKVARVLVDKSVMSTPLAAAE